MQVRQNARINVDLDYRYLANKLARQLETKEAAWNEVESILRRQIVLFVFLVLQLHRHSLACTGSAGYHGLAPDYIQSSFVQAEQVI